MKKFNLAALPLAVAGVLASTSAFAGTEACFEVYRVAADGVVVNHDVPYSPASCIAENVRGINDAANAAIVAAGTAPAAEIAAAAAAIGATDLAPTVNGSIAWELTGDVDVNLEALGTASPRHHIVYIPTSQLSSSARVTMKLSGADFGTANANQIFLVLDDGTKYKTVATSDGSLDNGSEVLFIVGNESIPAGSRLLLSSVNADGEDSDGVAIAGIGLHIANEETCTITPSVTIAATSAFSDNNQIVEGGISEPQDILNISEQFTLVSVMGSQRDALVNAESPSLRTEFVNNEYASSTWTDETTADSLFWETKFINNFDTLDQFVTLTTSDVVTVSVSADSSTGEGVTFGVYTANDETTDTSDASVLDATALTHLSAAAGSVPTLVDFLTSDDEVALTTTPAAYSAYASDYFQEKTGVAAVTNAALVLRNHNGEIMEFNYEVDTDWSLTFGANDKLGKSSCSTTKPFAVGVNGAVLKVPYTYTTANSGFVRITNEHTSEASVFMDIFGEDTDYADVENRETKNVSLGVIAPKSSKVFTTSFLVGEAKNDDYSGTGDRHTMTFTVTAPKDKVHGVSVQTVPGGVDRVMPVLDQNDWSQ